MTRQRDRLRGLETTAYWSPNNVISPPQPNLRDQLKTVEGHVLTLRLMRETHTFPQGWDESKMTEAITYAETRYASLSSQLPQRSGQSYPRRTR